MDTLADVHERLHDGDDDEADADLQLWPPLANVLEVKVDFFPLKIFFLFVFTTTTGLLVSLAFASETCSEKAKWLQKRHNVALR